MFRRILVTLDGSVRSEGVIPQVRDLARCLKAEVRLLRVAVVQTPVGGDPVDAQVRGLAEAQAYVDAWARRLSADDLRVTAAIRIGDPAAQILDHAAAHEVDLIAMATHGRGGLSRLLVGSVAETVLRRATLPVLLVRAAG